MVIGWMVYSFHFRYVFRNAKKVGLQELGPRFTLKLRSLQKGSFDSKFGEYEWVHKVIYMQLFFFSSATKISGQRGGLPLFVHLCLCFLPCEHSNIHIFVRFEPICGGASS